MKSILIQEPQNWNKYTKIQQSDLHVSNRIIV